MVLGTTMQLGSCRNFVNGGRIVRSTPPRADLWLEACAYACARLLSMPTLISSVLVCVVLHPFL